MLLRALAKLRTQEQQKLAEWATSTVAAARARPVLQRSQTASIGADLGAAVSDLSSLRQAGVGYGAPAVIAIIGVDAAAAFSAPTSPASLESSTVVVDDFPGTTEEEAAWQASLVQGGGGQGRDPYPGHRRSARFRGGARPRGCRDVTPTSVLFGLDRYQLQAAALPQLRQLRHLLTAEYPHATASINGYTDSLGPLTGNLLLVAAARAGGAGLACGPRGRRRPAAGLRLRRYRPGGAEHAKRPAPQPARGRRNRPGSIRLGRAKRSGRRR